MLVLCVFAIVVCVCNAPYVEHNIAALTNVAEMCEFMMDHLHLRGTDEIDTVKVYANEMLQTIWSREISPYGPSDGAMAPGLCYLCGRKFLDSLQKMCCRGIYSDTLNRRVNRCLSSLAQQAHSDGSDLVITLQIQKNELDELKNIMRTGRELAKRIVYSPSFELDEDFFDWLILSAAGATSYSMVEDIGIATVTLGPWDKDVLEVFLQEKFFGKLIFEIQRGTPYWEMVIPFPAQERKVTVQLCQWSEFSGKPQKLRIKLKKVDETIIERVDTLVNDNLALAIGKDVCF